MTPSPALQNKVVLITGGAGSFGARFVRHLLDAHDPATVRIYSRDELKQYELARSLRDDLRVRYLIGDVRDVERLRRAFRDVDVVIHAAALKQVPVCEYNPFEAVQTNVIGTENVVTAAIEARVQRVLFISTDKAVNPVNLYGATKLCAEKVFVQGNSYAGGDGPHASFSAVRYGNVVGSRGSVVPLFIRQAREGVVTITDETMTRFWITMDQAVAFVVSSIERMLGGEIFVPRIPSARVSDLVQAIAPDAKRRILGPRPGEKQHEVLLTPEESSRTAVFDDHFAVYPAFPFWRPEGFPSGASLEQGFVYSSDTNGDWLTVDQLRTLSTGVVPVD